MMFGYYYSDPARVYGHPQNVPPQTLGHYLSGFDAIRIDELTKAINRLADAQEKLEK